jgi:chemosensory pili system protein ChpA (sensor histidine kinase/response regulator)
MTTLPTIDSGTLGWVKSEIQDTALQARELLKKAEADSSDHSAIRLCATYLHQIYGTLTMVELDGAARLVHESEALAQSLADGQTQWNSVAGSALRRAMDDLSSYLEGLQSNPVPSPLQLVEPINRVLQARGDETISELELFAPDLSARPPDAHLQSKVDSTLFLKLADDLRVRFERALLNVLRNHVDREALNEIYKVFNNLTSIDRRGSLRQLWWISAAIGEALLDGSLEFNDEVRIVFARVNEQLKRLQDKSQAVRRRAPPDELIKRGLLLLAHSDAAGVTATGVRKSFGLDEWVRKGAVEGLPDVESLGASLAQFLSETEMDLEQAQNLLARYFSPQGGGSELLGRLAARLDSLLVAARRNELEVFVRLIGALIDVVDAIRTRSLTDLDNASLQMAGALLFVQDSGSGIRPGPDWKGQAEANISALRHLLAGQAQEGDEGAWSPGSAGVSEEVARAAATEVRGELQYVEHALEQVANKESSSRGLKAVEAHLKRIEGTLEILEQSDAAQLTEQLRQAVHTVVETDALEPRMLDALAMAVGTLGLCADELRAGGTLERLAPTIKRARDELTGVAQASEASDIALELESFQPDAGPVSDNFDSVDLDLTIDDFSESETDAKANDENSFHDVEFLPLELEVEGELEEDGSDTDEGSVPPTAAVEDAEDELVGIFFEEAGEIVPQVAASKARWREDEADQGSLIDLRRGFHTLKGSGRFAGATAIAELSWIVEDLLNDVLEGDLEPGPPVHDFVDRAHDLLDGLVRKRDTHAIVDLAPWSREAEALKSATTMDLGELALDLGAELLDFQHESDSEAVVSEGFDSDVPGADFRVLDDSEQVFEVFHAELDGHIETIADCVAQARRSFPDWVAPEKLLRTTHTLRGVLRSVGMESPAHVADGLDDLLNFLGRRGRRPEEVDIVLMDQAGRLFGLVAGNLDPSLVLTERQNLQFEELAEALTHRLQHHALGVPAVDPAIHELPPSDSVVLDLEPDEPLVQASPDQTLEGEEDELIQAFREEGQEILARLEQQVGLWRGGAPAAAVLSAMRRELHTFKGGARAVGWTSLGELAHQTETLLEDPVMAQAPRAPVSDLLQEVHDVAAVAVVSPPRHMENELEGLARRVEGFEFGTLSEVSPGPVETPRAMETSRKPAAGAQVDGPLEEPAHVATAEPADDAPPPSVIGSDVRAVRVRTEVLDELVSYSGEVSILRSRLQQQIQMVKSNLNELGDTVRLFRDQLRDLEIESEAQMLATNERIREEGGVSEFDPLELDRFSRLQTLSRNLGESLGSLVSIQAGISEFAGDAENTLQQQRHLSESLQEGLLKTRMISFVSMVPRLRHLTRRTSTELGRSVNLEVSGERVEVDRKILDQMLPSFEHMIRNAVAHGVENFDERLAAGKPSNGTIRIGLEQDGNDIVIRIADDGRGIDIPAIEARARTLGLLAPGENMSDEELMRALATSGLSTAKQVTQVSGRGVGMDVVSEMVRQLGGSIAVETVKGEGTTFILRVPVTLAVSHALLVYAGEQMFAIPARLIVNVLRVPKVDLEQGDEDADAYTYYNDRRTPVLNLANRLGLPFRQDGRKVASVIMVRAGLREIGLWVESISDTREVVVKPVGPLLQSIPGIGAVTLLGDGSIVLILDVPELWRMRRLNVESDTYAVAPTRGGNLTVMVVDDSMTVRNVMGRDLQNNGFEVILAKDGVDAIEQLRHAVPDILLVDLEMPRMDGFELTRRVRDDENLKLLPILVITSRAGTRHRDQAISLGANGYMSKPYRLDELVKSISSLTTAPSSTVSGAAKTYH